MKDDNNIKLCIIVVCIIIIFSIFYYFDSTYIDSLIKSVMSDYG